jgi:type IV pilus assembly protein PilC
MDAKAVITTRATQAPTHFIRFSRTEQVLFAKRLAFLIHAGVSVLESVTILRNQAPSHRSRQIYDTIIADVSAGHTLSKSLERYSNLFGSYSINIIRTGETAGALAENLMHLADELAKRRALEHKVLGALVYPTFISIASIGVTGLLVVFIFPKIMPIFTSLNVTLPWTTRALLAVSTYLHDWGLVTFLGVLIAITCCEILRRTIYQLRYALDRVILALPIIGAIAKSYNCAQFCRTLKITTASGISLAESLHITADVTKNTVFKKAYIDFEHHIVRGEKISTALRGYPHIFPMMLSPMIHIGETTGALSQTLEYLSQLYDGEVDEQTKNLSNSIEPILLLTMGLLVGLIAVSIITPIYEVTKHLGSMG